MKCKLQENKGILITYPEGALSEADFRSLTATADNYIKGHGNLNGLMIVTDDFPGWENPSGFLSHIKFVHDHHKQIKKVAIVSNSTLLNAIPAIARHFVAAEVQGFETEAEAMAWMGA